MQMLKQLVLVALLLCSGAGTAAGADPYLYQPPPPPNWPEGLPDPVESRDGTVCLPKALADAEAVYSASLEGSDAVMRIQLGNLWLIHSTELSAMRRLNEARTSVMLAEARSEADWVGRLAFGAGGIVLGFVALLVVR